MSTVRDAIIDAIEARLVPLVDLVEIEPAGEPDRGDMLQVMAGDDRRISEEGPLSRYRWTVAVGGCVEGPDGRELTAQRNSLHARVVAAVLRDDQLGGLVELIEDADCRRWTIRSSDPLRICFDQDFIIQFTTRRGDPARAA